VSFTGIGVEERVPGKQGLKQQLDADFLLEVVESKSEFQENKD